MSSPFRLSCILPTFNLANRDDMLHAFADKLPSLLPYVLMAYQQRSPLVTQRVDGSHEVLWSEAGVSQGDPVGPLLFALTYSQRCMRRKSMQRM